jgi:hypothetical protein
MIKMIFISIGLLLVLGVLSLVILQIRNSQNISQIETILRSDPTQQQFTEAMIAELPTPVQRYFLHAIVLGTPLATSAQLTMCGQFRFDPGKPWLPMQAQEILNPRGFIWRAKIGNGFSQFQGADYYCDRIGRMQFALLGLVPIVNVQNVDIARSAIGRLAAELVWLPSALLLQQGVEWSAIDNHTLQARLRIDDEPVTLTLIVDDNGKLLESYALRWGDHTKDGSWAYIPMGGKCYTEHRFGGFTIPSQMGVGWWFGSEQYFEFFQSTIVQAEF